MKFEFDLAANLLDSRKSFLSTVIVNTSSILLNLNNFFCLIKGATKLYFTQYPSVVIIFLNGFM